MQHRILKKGRQLLSVFETLSLMIAFGILVANLVKNQDK